GSWFDEVYGEGEEGIFEEVVIGIRDDPGSPGVDIRRDLLAALEGPAIVVGGSANLNTKSGDPVLIAVKAKNEAQVLKAVDRMLSGDPDVDSRTISSVKAWVFRDTSDRSEDDDESFGPDMSKVAVCVHQGYLMVATDVELLSAVMSKKADTGSLAASTKFQKVSEYLDKLSDKNTILRQYANPSIDLRQLYEQLRAGRIQDATSPRGRLLANFVEFLASPADDASATSKAPWNKLPAFEKVSPFFSEGGAIGRRDADGWTIRSFTLK
ncbi:MAG: hypothetical protein MI757_09555, partial [Pirellulales bacterium]|nr:hypothetical protein [Pirellulales bacterium]